MKNSRELWKRDGSMVCNEGFNIHSLVVQINRAPCADMSLHQKHFQVHSRAQIYYFLNILWQ